jgi:hypothetical protein
MKLPVARPFVSHADPKNIRVFPDLKSVQQFLASKFSGGYCFGVHELTREGIYKEMGYVYDFRPFLKKFLVNDHDHLYAAYAPNRTMLRKVCILDCGTKVWDFPKR